MGIHHSKRIRCNICQSKNKKNYLNNNIECLYCQKLTQEQKVIVRKNLKDNQQKQTYEYDTYIENKRNNDILYMVPYYPFLM